VRWCLLPLLLLPTVDHERQRMTTTGPTTKRRIRSVSSSSSFTPRCFAVCLMLAKESEAEKKNSEKSRLKNGGDFFYTNPIHCRMAGYYFDPSSQQPGRDLCNSADGRRGAIISKQVQVTIWLFLPVPLFPCEVVSYTVKHH
jgi:hypothetical protein